MVQDVTPIQICDFWKLRKDFQSRINPVIQKQQFVSLKMCPIFENLSSQIKTLLLACMMTAWWPCQHKGFKGV